MWTKLPVKLNSPSPCLVPLVRCGGNVIVRFINTVNRLKTETPRRSMALQQTRERSREDQRTTSYKRVSIEGNIAVGKSTFARLLQSACPDWEVVPEPVAQWQNIQSGANGVTSECTVSNLLQMMYADPQRWSYTFQTHSCMSRMRTQLQPQTPRVLQGLGPRVLQGLGPRVQVYERSIYSDRYIFALNSYELGHINPTEWAIYQDWHSLLVHEFGHRVALEGIIYLRAPPQTCMERLQKRARAEEQSVQQDYLNTLHTQHERWLMERTTAVDFESLRRAPVLQLDASVEFKSDPHIQQEYITKVMDFLRTL